MKRINLKLLLLIVFLSILFLPSKAFGADKTYYWTTNLSEYSCNLFQENNDTEIDTDNEVGMIANGTYKFLFYNGTNYIAMNDMGAGYSKDAQSLLSTMTTSEKGIEFVFSVFVDTQDYTPKTYKEMLERSKICVYGTNNNLIQTIPTLDYKNYIKFPSSSKFNVEIEDYLKNGDIVTGISTKISWSLDKDETPYTLRVVNDDIDYESTYDMQEYTNKNSIKAALELNYNGTYTFILLTSKGEYSKDIKCTKLELEPIKSNKDDTKKYTEGTKIDNSEVKIEYSGIPKKNIEQGSSFQLIITTNVPTNIDLDGRVDSTYQKKHKFNITENGTYTIVAVSEAGKSAKKKVKINCFVEPKDDGLEYYSRDAYWNGSANSDTNQNTLAQTGMYDTTLLVVGILFLFSALLVLAEIVRKDGLKWRKS